MANKFTLTAPLEFGKNGPTTTFSTSNPEGVVTAPPGSEHRNSSTGTVWRKTSGTGNTGWEQLGLTGPQGPQGPPGTDILEGTNPSTAALGDLYWDTDEPDPSYMTMAAGDGRYLSKDAMPIGMIMAYGGTTPPTGWHLCDGSAHGSSELQAVIGSANTPDLRGRFILGVSPSHPNKETGGAETHTLTVPEMPSHTHAQNSHNHTQDSHNHTQNSHSHWTSGLGSTVGVPGGSYTAAIVSAGSFTTGSATATNQAATAVNQATTATNQNTGGGDPHNNMPPYYALTYVIKKS